MDISSAFDAVTLRKTGISDLFDIGNMVSAGAAGIIGTIVALGAAIWICVAVLPEKKRKNAKGFLKTLGDLLSLDYLIIEHILRFFYVLATCSCIAVGLFSIFSTKGASLLIVLIGPFVCRLAYESAMLFIIMAKRTIDINNRLKTIAPDSGEDAFGGIDTSGLKSVVSKAANAAGQKLQQAAQAAEKPAEKAPAHLAPESKPGDTGADSDTDSAE